MGDLSGARRFFESMVATAQAEERKILEGMVAMLCLRMGDLEGARKRIHHDTASTENRENDDSVLPALLSMAESDYSSAVTAWRSLQGTKHHKLTTHNLAVCLVYTGQLSE
ncbi:MAG: hypothetical protein LQ346_009133, partial [Caloplaca aetnensis]